MRPHFVTTNTEGTIMAIRRSTQRYLLFGVSGYLAYHFLIAHSAHRR